MIRINLLPHRERKRERRKKEFVGLAAACAAGAGVLIAAVGMGIGQASAAQSARNALLQAENARLDAQIREIANLRAEIDGLRARQQAVENLQSDRTVPVHLLDELARHTPEGLQLRQIRQDGMKVTLTGYAQSNERVSALLRRLAHDTPWLEKPELGEIKLTTLPAPAPAPAGAPGAAAREPRRAYEFTLAALLRRPGPAPQPGASRLAGGPDGTTQAGQAKAGALASAGGASQR